MSRTAITLKLKMCPLWDEACSCAEKLLTDINLPSLMPDEDNNFGGSLVSDFRKWWRHMQPKNTMYYSFYKRVQTKAAFVAKHKHWRANLGVIQAIVCITRFINVGRQMLPLWWNTNTSGQTWPWYKPYYVLTRSINVCRQTPHL